jgi:hypothetical protein
MGSSASPGVSGTGSANSGSIGSNVANNNLDATEKTTNSSGTGMRSLDDQNTSAASKGVNSNANSTSNSTIGSGNLSGSGTGSGC